LAIGGDLRPERLVLAYRSGIFPWFSAGQPLLWFSLDPRTVLETNQVKVPRSLGKVVRQRRYRITLDQAFAAVIAGCAQAPRPNQEGTWIDQRMQEAYLALHEAGFAHSAEAWDDQGQLVGGLYGVAVGRLFAGESMFARSPDASKVAFVHLVRQLERWGFPLIDCQMATSHLARFGAIDWPRERYLEAIGTLARPPDRLGPWSFDQDFWCDG
jgi:leucyl/phenylalanyl-tRNA--protein transferase